MSPLPLLQLVHLSDMHFVAAGANSLARARRDARRLLWRIPLRFLGQNFFNERMAGHDPKALTAFRDALRKIRLADPASWSKTCLLVTGDLSTLGDDASFNSAIAWVRDVSGQVGVPLAPIILYGNHDVWKGELPWFTPPATLDAHRSQLRARNFANNWPLGPLYPTPASPKGLELHSLNTVLHDRILNTCAWGYVGADRYWQNAGLPDQSDDLVAKAIARGRPVVRLVFTHHPVHVPDFHPRRMNHVTLPKAKPLLNSRYVATTTGAPGPPAGDPVVEVFLSGHMHYTLPEIGALPSSLAAQLGTDTPLVARQVQLIAGTLSQLGLSVDPNEHSFQLLRFFEEPGPELILERIVYERNGRSGPFEPAAGIDGALCAERIRLAP